MATKSTKSTKPAWAEAVPYEVAPIPGGWLILSNPPVKVDDPMAVHCPAKVVSDDLCEWLIGETGGPGPWEISGYAVHLYKVHSVHYGRAYYQWELKKGKTTIAKGAESTVAIALARELGYGIA